MHQRLIILGSTGSIGCSALEVVAGLGDGARIVGLAAGRDWEKLARQAARFRVPAVAIADEACAADLRRACPPKTRVLTGPEGLVELVQASDTDFVLAAIVGVAGLPATLAAAERGVDIGLANKESLVVAGSIIMPLAQARGGRLIPVDSEHSAIFQALMSGRAADVRRIYLTASGGPFRTWPKERMAAATIAAALDHPVWSMGPKITIDSATMMNKALEIIEAHYLFNIPVNQLEVLVHPESIVHSMVEFCDGSVIAQLGTPDMRTPIQYAITYPDRMAGLAPPLTWTQSRRLNFEPPDPERFPALKLGHEAAARGGTCGAVLNAANEAAVERFRAGEVKFGQIAELAGRALRRHRGIAQPTLADLMQADAWARQEVHECIRVGTC